jgi:hypothetical protein
MVLLIAIQWVFNYEDVIIHTLCDEKDINDFGCASECLDFICHKCNIFPELVAEVLVIIDGEIKYKHFIDFI